jgi:hypothetical protein
MKLPQDVMVALKMGAFDAGDNGGKIERKLMLSLKGPKHEIYVWPSYFTQSKPVRVGG